jgi:ABC-type glycerol-3-phosphate transport system substrate-binding protein
MGEPTTTTRRGTSRRAALRGAGMGLAGAAAVACSAPGGAEPPAASKAPVTLSFMSWRPIAMDQFEPIWTEYGKKNNVTFDVDKSDDSNLTKLTTMFAADAGMDLFDASTGVMPRMYDAGFVLQLDKYLSRDKLTLDKDWAILGIERWRQKTYGVAYWSEPHAIYYNKTLFKQKGIEDPWVRTRNQGDWTLDEMVDAAKRINDPANDVWGMHWGLDSYNGLGVFIWTQGVSHVQYDPNVEIKLQIPESVEAHTWASDWLTRQQINVSAATPAAIAARERIQGGKPAIDRGGTNLFATGKIGIHWRSVNDWRRMWPIIGNAFEWDMLPVPSVKGKPGAGWTAGHPLSAWSKSKHPDEAWAFMKWMVQDEFQAFLAENQYLVPAKKSHQAQFFRVPSQFPYQHPQVFANIFKRPYGIIWAHYNAAKNTSMWSTEVNKIFSGEVPMQAGLREMDRLLNQDIDYGGGENPFKGVRWPIQPK